MFCSARNTNIKLKVPLIPSGIPSLKLPCPKVYLDTADAATIGGMDALLNLVLVRLLLYIVTR